MTTKPELIEEVLKLQQERDDYAARLKAADRSWATVALERDNWRGCAQALAGRMRHHFDVWDNEDLPAMQHYNTMIDLHRRTHGSEPTEA